MKNVDIMNDTEKYSIYCFVLSPYFHQQLKGLSWLGWQHTKPLLGPLVLSYLYQLHTNTLRNTPLDMRSDFFWVKENCIKSISPQENILMAYFLW